MFKILLKNSSLNYLIKNLIFNYIFLFLNALFKFKNEKDWSLKNSVFRSLTQDLLSSIKCIGGKSI